MTGSYWDKTWNVVVGCDPVSDGCEYCFAVPTSNIRQANPHPAIKAVFEGTVAYHDGQLGWTGKVNEIEARLDDPYAWRKDQWIYITLLGDMFHAGVSFDFAAKTFARVATTGRHTYLCTTKRHGRMRALLNDDAFRDRVATYAAELTGRRGAEPWSGQWPLPNLYLAVSVEDQATANLRIPALLETPAAVRWISAEPLLRAIDLTRIARPSKKQPDLVWDVLGKRYGVPGLWQAPMSVGLDWVVTGGESNSPRPVHPDHVRQIRDQCVAAGVPMWFKQWGEFKPEHVFDHPGFVGDRMFNHPRGGTASPIIREPGPGGTMRGSTTRLMEPGERTKGVVMLDRDTIAVKVGAKAAGRELDGRTWDQLPAGAVRHAVKNREES